MYIDCNVMLTCLGTYKFTTKKCNNFCHPSITYECTL